MNKNIVSELFGREEHSDDYLNLLKNYQMTKEEGISIGDETIKSVSPFNRHGTYEDYEMMITVDEFRKRFLNRFREIHNREINLNILNNYKSNKLSWQITNDIKKTMEFLEPYTDEDFANDIFLKDLVKYNLKIIIFLNEKSHIIIWK